MSDWPPAFRHVAELIGEEHALAIARVYPGVELYIPRSPREGSKLVDLIGMEAATKLASEYGGDKLHPPTMNRLGRKRAIACASGSLTEVALRFQVSRRWVSFCRNGK